MLTPLRERCTVLPSAQRSFFEESVPAMPPATGLFAEIVFNRPLDHAFTYAVPESLRGGIAVGKRVLAPFGKGDRPTVGFCVGLHATGPERTVKELVSVVDEQVLLTPGLLRLTRWMADYLPCGWGQVLNAVVPAGARESAWLGATTYLAQLMLLHCQIRYPCCHPQQSAWIVCGLPLSRYRVILRGDGLWFGSYRSSNCQRAGAPSSSGVKHLPTAIRRPILLIRRSR